MPASPLLRRLGIVLLAALVLLPLGAPHAASPKVRDLGKRLGLPQKISSWDAEPFDYDGDGWTDLFISHHGDGGMLYHNDHAGGRSLGFTEVWNANHHLVHRWRDRHACAWGDVNRDGMPDLMCMKGAAQGTAKKWNELWIQGPKPGKFTDEAHAYGVEDIWGRGRYPAFIDLNGDRFPDLFLGNDYPRQDEHRSPNRTFLNRRGTHFDQVNLGISKEVGARCVQVLDLNRDGRDDLVLCGQHHLFVYIKKAGRFVDRRRRYGIPDVDASWARFHDLNGDGRRDLVVVELHALTIWLRGRDGRFHAPVVMRPLRHGHGAALGDIDGDGDPDVLAVQACQAEEDVPDVLLLNRRNGHRWRRRWRLPRPGLGCGDVAATMDFDRDGAQDFVVLNGGFVRYSNIDEGPDQVLTMGDWAKT